MNPIYLFITPFFPSPDCWHGGYCFDAVRSLLRQKLPDGQRYDIRVVLTRKGSDYEYEGIKVYCCEREAFPCGLGPFLLARRNRRHFIKMLKRVHLNVNDISVCHAHTMNCVEYANILKSLNPRMISLLQHHCSYPIRLESGRLGRVPIHATVQYFYLRRQCQAIDGHIFVSEASRNSFGKRYLRKPEGRIVDVRKGLLFGFLLPMIRVKRSYVLYNGIDPRVFNGSSSTSKGGGAREIFTIGCVANFQPLKDQKTLIRAFRRVVETVKDKVFRLRFLGGGEMLDSCRRLVRELDIESLVSFETEIDHLRMPDFYRSLDLFVLPSRLEGFCCSFIEANACGVPIIGCRGISVEEVLSVKEQSLCLATPQDDADLAEKMLYAIDPPGCQEFIRSMNIDSLMKEFVLWINQVKGGLND